MRHIAFTGTALVVAAVLSSAPAQALNTRSFVSAQSGSDSNTCTRLSPCRTFAYAITQTSAGGEINTLDPGGYGPVTITQAISIVSGLGEAGVLVPSGGTGITINAGPTDVVNLRGLIIEGAGVGQDGIDFNTGGALTIENCVVRNLTGNGHLLRAERVGLAGGIEHASGQCGDFIDFGSKIPPTAAPSPRPSVDQVVQQYRRDPHSVRGHRRSDPQRGRQ